MCLLCDDFYSENSMVILIALGDAADTSQEGSSYFSQGCSIFSPCCSCGGNKRIFIILFYSILIILILS